jgi:hypothetical protein
MKAHPQQQQRQVQVAVSQVKLVVEALKGAEKCLGRLLRRTA